MTTVYDHPEMGREVLTASGERMHREDAEALAYTIAPYTDLVPTSERIATAHAEHSDLVRLPPFGMLVTKTTAKNMGFAVSQIAAAPRGAPRADPQASWRSAIMTAQEAKDRPAATAELLTTRTPETLTVEQARSFLRGLPVEIEQAETTETMTTNEDPRAARLAEISNSMAAYNKSMGHAAKPKTAHHAVAPSNIEPAKLKRLTEIRLNALHLNGQERSQEAKTLRLALDTHNRVGTPLAQAFVQLGFDASKLLPAA